MAWRNKVFSTRDFIVFPLGVVIIQCLAALLANRYMFHPVKGGYDESLDGLVCIGTNDHKVVAVLTGPARGKKAIIYCHGNMEDATSGGGRFSEIADNGYTIATIEYPGYGLADGHPNEADCYRNAHRLYDWLVGERGFSGGEIFVVGYSLGTGVAVELAATREVAGLWLEAPFLSASRVITRIRLLLIDPFPNVSRIGQINCPLVILHGTDDKVIPFRQGRALYGMAKGMRTFVPIVGAGHTDFVERLGGSKYQKLLMDFLEGAEK